MRAGWLLLVTLLGAAAGPLPPEACAACRITPAPDPGLCARALGTLAALGRWRDAFLSAPRYQELFPVVYWHVTRAELALIAEGKHADPNAALRQIDLFHDAYAWNRARFEAGDAPEPHWRAHFALASEADHDFGQIGGGMAMDTPDMVERVLGSGVLAHIDHDLPRSLRASFETRPGGALEPAAAVAGDYRITDGIFARVTAATDVDIGAAIRATSRWDKALTRPEVLAWFGVIMDRWGETVLAHRHAAWEAAVGAGVLPTGAAAHPPPMPRPAPECP